MAKAYSTHHGMRKRCCTCLTEFTLDKFHKSNQASDGLNPRCADCQSEAVKKCIAKKIAAGLPRETKEQRKKANERKLLAYQSNPEKYKAISAKNRRLRPEKTYASSRNARAKRPGSASAYAYEYYKKNVSVLKPRMAAQTMKRYARKVSATPAWADQSAILAFYQEAARITKETGIQHQVDHIVPLLSKMVCGLHVQNNLQILDKSSNIKKGNRHWPDQA